jgi:hypothetical protein
MVAPQKLLPQTTRLELIFLQTQKQTRFEMLDEMNVK